MSEHENLKRRLNKIATKLDKYNLHIEIQKCYIQFLDQHIEPCQIVEIALDEARRLEAYYSKQIKELKEEHQMLSRMEQRESNPAA